MNRAEKRLAAKLAKHKPNRSKVRYLTNAQLDFETFDSIERLFLALRHGELTWDADGWCLMGLDGNNMHVLSALEGWLQYWSTLTEKQAIPYDDTAMRKLAKSLEYEKPLRMEEIDAAYAVLEFQRKLYRGLPKSVTTAVCKEVQASIRRDDELKAFYKEQMDKRVAA